MKICTVDFRSFSSAFQSSRRANALKFAQCARQKGRSFLSLRAGPSLICFYLDIFLRILPFQSSICYKPFSSLAPKWADWLVKNDRMTGEVCRKRTGGLALKRRPAVTRNRALREKQGWESTGTHFESENSVIAYFADAICRFQTYLLSIDFHRFPVCKPLRCFFHQ